MEAEGSAQRFDEYEISYKAYVLYYGYLYDLEYISEPFSFDSLTSEFTLEAYDDWWVRNWTIQVNLYLDQQETGDYYQFNIEMTPGAQFDIIEQINTNGWIGLQTSF